MFALLVSSALSFAASPALTGADLCAYYANTYTYLPSLKAAVETVPLGDDTRAQFTTLMSGKSNPQNSSLSVSCAGDIMTVTVAGQAPITVDFKNAPKNALIVNGKSLTLSTSRSAKDVLDAVHSAVSPKKSAWMLLEPRAYASDVSIKDVVTQGIYRSGTLAWKTSTTKEGELVVALTAVSVPRFNYSCGTSAGHWYSPVSNAWSSSACDVGVSGKMFRYLSGFKKFGFSCSAGKASSIHYELASYKEGDPAHSAVLNFQYTNGKVSRVEKKVSPALGTQGTFDTCITRLVDDVVVQATGSGGCLSADATEEFNGKPAKASVFQGEFYDQLDIDTPMYHVKCEQCIQDDPESNRNYASDLDLADAKLKGRIGLEATSPIANIALVQRCCGDSQCAAEVARIGKSNGKDSSFRSVAPAKSTR